MKKSLSLLTSMLLSSTLFWGVPSLRAEVLGGQGSIVKEPAGDTGYCHMKFPPMREETLSWEQPVLDEAAGNIVDFYGPCDYSPTGKDAVENQRREILHQEFLDGD